MPDNPLLYLHSCLAPSLDLKYQLQLSKNEIQRLQGENTELKQQIQQLRKK